MAKNAVRIGLVGAVSTFVLTGPAVVRVSAAPPAISGYATNFDVPNGTDKECEGFEIEIEDITDSQITYTWPGSFGYPNPYGPAPASAITNTTFADGHSGVRVKFVGTYSGGAWSAKTPIGTVNHFGVHVAGAPGMQRYTWLCDLGGSAAGSTGTLTPYGGTTQGNFYPTPSVPSVVPAIVSTPSGEGVQPTIAPAELPEAGDARLPDAVWTVKYEASSPNVVDVNQLLASDPEVQNAIANSQISSVAELFQPEPGGNEGLETEPADIVHPGDASSVTVTETYTYTGPVDPVDNSYTCNDIVNDPNNCSNFVGPLIARQMQSTQLTNTTVRVPLNVAVYTGKVLTGTGGNVTSAPLPGNSNPDSIDCGSDAGSCFTNVDSQSVVDLTAQPNPGYDFTSWSGACTGSSTTCSVTMSAAKQTKATFTIQPKLTVAISKHGNVTSNPAGIDCSRPIGVKGTVGTCKTQFPSGAVTLTATPAAGKTFVSWGGACAGTVGNQCTVTLSKNKSVKATFSG
ncbi:MAG: hypothetical protein JWL83_3092 [Actinomycetia bacterium]|nr:hypothetical protein [Actinomycetes bacterium]